MCIKYEQLCGLGGLSSMTIQNTEMQTWLNVTLYLQLAVLLLPSRWFRVCFDQ